MRLTQELLPHHPHIWLTAAGTLGLEHRGRSAVRSIEEWIALAWGDVSVCTTVATEPDYEDRLAPPRKR